MNRFMISMLTAGLSFVLSTDAQAANKSGGSSSGRSGGTSSARVSNLASAPKVSHTTTQNKTLGNNAINTARLNTGLNKTGNTNALNKVSNVGLNKSGNTNALNKVNNVGLNKGGNHFNGNQALARVARQATHHNYHHQHGRHHHYGWSYHGRHHHHWSYCYRDYRYGCYLYWCPYTFGYFYWCETDTCYYPCSYCPYNTYSYGETVIDTTCPVCSYETVCNGCQEAYQQPE